MINFFLQPRCVSHSVFGMTMGIFYDCGEENQIAERYFVCHVHAGTLSSATMQVKQTSAASRQYESTSAMLGVANQANNANAASLSSFGAALGLVCKAGLHFYYYYLFYFIFYFFEN